MRDKNGIILEIGNWVKRYTNGVEEVGKVQNIYKKDNLVCIKLSNQCFITVQSSSIEVFLPIDEQFPTIVINGKEDRFIESLERYM